MSNYLTFVVYDGGIFGPGSPVYERFKAEQARRDAEEKALREAGLSGLYIGIVLGIVVGVIASWFVWSVLAAGGWGGR